MVVRYFFLLSEADLDFVLEKGKPWNHTAEDIPSWVIMERAEGWEAQTYMQLCHKLTI